MSIFPSPLVLKKCSFLKISGAGKAGAFARQLGAPESFRDEEVMQRRDGKF